MEEGGCIVENLTLAGLIGLIGTILGIAATYFSMKRNLKADAAAEGKSSGIILNEIQHIQSGIGDIKKEQMKTSDQMMNFVREIAVMQNSLDAEHRRTDQLDSRLTALEKKG